MVKINKIVPPKAELFDPNNNSLGFVKNELEMNDVRIQIMRNNLKGYYFMFNNEKIPVNSLGEIHNWIPGFYDQLDNQLKYYLDFKKLILMYLFKEENMKYIFLMLIIFTFIKCTNSENNNNLYSEINIDSLEESSKKKISFRISSKSSKELREQSVKSYIERFSKVAVAEMDQFGIPASISMAQAIVESRSGTSVLAARNNNHFGIKCFSKSCPKGHCSNFTDDHHKDFFRKYTNPSDSWREHSQFLMKYRYKELLKYGKDYKKWAVGLFELGYSVDSNYDRKLIAIIERYELNKLDNL